MRAIAIPFTGLLCCAATATVMPAYAVPVPVGQSNSSLSATQLINGGTANPLISTDVLLGTSAGTRQSPTTAKKWVPNPVASRSVPTYWSVTPNRNSTIAHTPPSNPPSVSTAISLPELEPQPPSASEPIDSAQTDVNTALLERITSDVDARGTSESSDETASNNNVVAQALPSLESIQQIQRDLDNINIPGTARPRRTVFPGVTISNPSGYGADRGQIFAGIGFQSRTRFSGGANPGTIFGGGARDGTAGIGFGLGDARESVGVQLSYTAASFGGSRAPLSGGLNAKVHKQFGNGWAAAVGGEGIINIGRLPEDDDQIEFNDFEGTYYGVVTKTIALREDFYSPFSRVTLTGGAGTGRFRSADQIANGEFGVGAFGSAALQVFPSTSLITEWTGQDLSVGLSVAPFRNFPIVFTPAIRDIVGESDGDPRFVLGVGFSISDIFSKLGL